MARTDTRPRHVELGLGDEDVTRLGVAEQQLVEIARAVAVGCRVLVLDEPTRGLPGRDKRMLAGFVRDYAAQGRLVIVATHDVEFVARCTRTAWSPAAPAQPVSSDITSARVRTRPGRRGLRPGRRRGRALDRGGNGGRAHS